MDNIYDNIDEYNPNKNLKISIVFDDMNANMLSNKNPQPIVTQLFIRSRKTNISVIITLLFSCVKKYWSNLYAPLHYENSKQKRASANCN